MSNTYQDFSIKWSELGLKDKQSVTDVWRQASIGMIADAYQTAIPPHGVKLIRVINQ